MIQNDFEHIIEKLDNNELWDFPGGVFPAEQKTLSNQTPIQKLPIPENLYITVKQHIGVEGHLIVEVGQDVLKGQALSKSMNPFAVPVHAPTSGKVISIGKHVSAHPSGYEELTVEIASDQQNTWAKLTPLVDYQNLPKVDVLTAICEAGISGMGGAGFPTHIKSSPKKDVEFLIINGIECEPYITSDDRLMREHAWQIRQGIDVLCHLLSPKHVIIGIENNKPEAIEAMQVACRENPNYRVCVLPTKYPAGGEKQLIQVLTNREVPAQGLPIDVGVIMHNVGTCFAIADAIFTGKPLIERVVTVSGEAVEKPGNFWTLIGTPIACLLEQAIYKSQRQKQTNVIMGGPMMGFSVISSLVPVVKTTNCILVPTDKEIAGNNEQACIRCGACADVCPASLLPQQLFWHSKAKELEKAQDYNLFDCIECGACAYVCPSEIPLVHYYRIAKSEIRVEQEEKQKADKARERFETRAARLIAEQQARDEKHRLAAEARKQTMASSGNGAKDKIAAALARAKAKKLAASEATSTPIDASTASNLVSEATDNQANVETTEAPVKSASSNQRVQAAIARAKAKKLAASEASQLSSTEAEPPENNNSDDKSQDTEVKSKASASKIKNDRVQAAIAKAKAKKAATQKNASNTQSDAPIDAADEKPNSPVAVKEKTASDIASSEVTPSEVTPSEVTAPEIKLDKQSASKPVITVETQVNEPIQQPAPEANSKQAKIAAAVAKAKAKREAKKQEKIQQATDTSIITDEPIAEIVEPEATAAELADQQMELKKRRIATAVAKAKAKKAAEKAAEKTALNTAPNKEDKPS